MAASRRNKEGLKLKPMTEENCALMAGYKYCPKNIRSIGVVEAQQKSIRISCRLINGFPTQCSCPYVGRTKCATQACPNRCIFIACTPTCDPKCQNNPWAHDLFVAGKKTFLKQTEKGFGLFSTTLIQKNTFIGEYTGVVTLDNADLTVEEHSYAFGIAPAGYIIQGFHQGTCMRCVNHSCDPNCEAIQYIHDDEYKIIFSSMNDIPPNTELTIDYGWMHDDIRDAPICKCGSTNCKNIIGSIRPKTHMSKRRRKIQGKRKVARVNNVDPLATEHAPCIPPTFRSTINDTTTEVSEILASTPRPEERPDDYIETHVFRAAEPSYILTQYNGRLGIVRGRVTECYTNNYGFTIYVVDVRSPASMQYHMPRYLCFHYPEDAAYVLQHHIPDEERDMISHYSTPYASREVADGLEYSMPETYSQMVIDGTFPSTRLEKRRFPGPVALGLPPFRLIQCDSDDEPEDETEDECQDEPVHEHRLRSGPKQRIGMTSEQLNAGQEIGRDEGPVKCVTSRVVAVQYIEAYNPLYRRDFKITKNSLHNVTLISRIMESAKENLTWFSISRIRNDIEVDYNDCYSEISSVINYYYNDARPSQKRFLTASHFNMANEANVPGSTLRCFCSFCKIKFNDDEPLRLHFQQFHSIVAIYKCSLCEQQFSLPSLFRRHIFICDATLGLSLILNVNLPIMDAFADYSASRTRNNAPMHVLKPGLLNFTRKATKFRIQSTYENILSDWPVHKHIYNTPNQPNTVRDTEETEEPRPGPSSRQVRPDPLRSKTRARHQRQKTTISSDEDISEEMQDCEQVHDDTEEEPTPPTTRQGRERNITKYTSRHQRPHEDEDDEDPRPDPSYQPQGRDEQRSHHHRRNRLQDSDQIRGQDSAEGRRLGPCSRLPRKDQTKSKKRSREQRRVGIPESDEDSCNRMDENTENECPETRQPCQSNKARKTVKRGSKPRSQHLGNKVLEDEQSDYTEKPGRLARAAAIKAADKIKETQHSDKNYSWIGPASSSDSGEHDVSVYKPEKKRSRK